MWNRNKIRESLFQSKYTSILLVLGFSQVLVHINEEVHFQHMIYFKARRYIFFNSVFLHNFTCTISNFSHQIVIKSIHLRWPFLLLLTLKNSLSIWPTCDIVCLLILLNVDGYNQSKIYFKIVDYEIAVSSIFVMKSSIRCETALVCM